MSFETTKTKAAHQREHSEVGKRKERINTHNREEVRKEKIRTPHQLGQAANSSLGPETTVPQTNGRGNKQEKKGAIGRLLMLGSIYRGASSLVERATSVFLRKII